MGKLALTQKISMTRTIEYEKYFLSLIKKRSQLIIAAKKGFSQLPQSQKELEETLESLGSVDSIIKIIENNFTFYKEDK